MPAWGCWRRRYASLLLAQNGARVPAKDILVGGDLGAGCLASREYRPGSLASLESRPGGALGVAGDVGAIWVLAIPARGLVPSVACAGVTAWRAPAWRAPAWGVPARWGVPAWRAPACEGRPSRDTGDQPSRNKKTAGPAG
jgi:hypothetical protein